MCLLVIYFKKSTVFKARIRIENYFLVVNTKINCFKFIQFYFKSYYIKGDGSLYKLLCWIVTTLGMTTEDQTFYFSSNSGTCGIGLRWSRGCMEVLCGGILTVYIPEQRLCHLWRSGSGCKVAGNILMNQENEKVTKWIEILLFLLNIWF